MNKQVGRLAEVAAFQHCLPEQAVEVNNIFTDEVVQLGGGVFLPVFIEAYAVAALVAQILERTHIANRRIQPDVEIFTRAFGISKPKYGASRRYPTVAGRIQTTPAFYLPPAPATHRCGSMPATFR